MERFNRFNDGARVALATISSGLSVLLLDPATRMFGSRVWGSVVAIFVVTLLALALDSAVHALLDRSVTLRRWIAGDDFLEGWWMDTATNTDGGPPTHAAIQQICFGDKGFDLSGASYLPSGEKLATWSSVATSYERRTLYVIYEAQTNLVAGGFERGLVQMQFDRPPNSYTGYLTDFSGNVTRRIAGKRVTDAELAAHGQLATPSDRSAFLRPHFGRVAVADG